MADGLVQSDLDDPLKFLQLAATAQPKIRFNLGLGAFRCALLPIDEQLRRAHGIRNCARVYECRLVRR